MSSPKDYNSIYIRLKSFLERILLSTLFIIYKLIAEANLS